MTTSKRCTVGVCKSLVFVLTIQLQKKKENKKDIVFDKVGITKCVENVTDSDAVILGLLNWRW